MLEFGLDERRRYGRGGGWVDEPNSLKPWLHWIDKDADPGIPEVEDAKKRLAGWKEKSEPTGSQRP